MAKGLNGTSVVSFGEAVAFFVEDERVV